MSTCQVDGCNGTVRCKGLCGKHYSAKRAHGTPTPRKSTPAERFWAKVNKTEACWVWVGALTGSGYGNFKAPERNIGAHLWAYAELVGPIPSGQVLDHVCRNRACVNPDHLEPVSNRTNVMRGIHPKVLLAVANVCSRGHDISGDNAYIHPRWGRACRTCRAMHRKRIRSQRSAA